MASLMTETCDSWLILVRASTQRAKIYILFVVIVFVIIATISTIFIDVFHKFQFKQVNENEKGKLRILYQSRIIFSLRYFAGIAGHGCWRHRRG